MKKLLVALLLLFAMLTFSQIVLADEVSYTSVWEGDLVRTYIFVEVKNEGAVPQEIANLKLQVYGLSGTYTNYPYTNKLMAASTWPRIINPGKSGYMAFEIVRPASEVDPQEELRIAKTYSVMDASHKARIGWFSSVSLSAPWYVPNEKDEWVLNGEFWMELGKPWDGQSGVATLRDQNGKLLYVGYTCELGFTSESSVRIPINPSLYDAWRQKGLEIFLGESFTIGIGY